MDQRMGNLEARSRVVIVGAGYAGYHCGRHLERSLPRTRLVPGHAIGIDLENRSLAQLVTRAYHLYALPANRLRVATDWFINIIRHHQLVQLGLITGESPDLAMAEDTGTYYRTDGQPFSRQRQEATK